jgi:Protein of unknown function (DUF2877)
MSSSRTIVRVTAIGWKAAVALAASDGAATVLAVLSESTYLMVGADLVWLGSLTAERHARAVLADEWRVAAASIGFDLSGVDPWRPRPVDDPVVSVVRAGSRELLAAIRAGAIGEPRGLGGLLTGGALGFPLAAAVPYAEALAQACEDDDAAAAERAAAPLLGLGPGLTPSGDDFVGGAFFARAILGNGRRRPDSPWTLAAGLVRERARGRTHPISFTLLSDLLSGDGHASLHDVAMSTATADLRRSIAAALRLVRIGHSSGWDILAGCVAGILGREAFRV